MKSGRASKGKADRGETEGVMVKESDGPCGFRFLVLDKKMEKTERVGDKHSKTSMLKKRAGEKVDDVEICSKIHTDFHRKRIFSQ